MGRTRQREDKDLKDKEEEVRDKSSREGTSRVVETLGVCGAFGPWTPSARRTRIRSGTFGQTTLLVFARFGPKRPKRLQTYRPTHTEVLFALLDARIC